MVANWASYRTPSEAHRRLGLVCLGVGAQRGVVPCGPRALDSHAAVLLTAGRGRLHLDGAEYPLRAPVLFWLRPGQRHSYGPDRHGWSESWVLFDGPATAGYAELGYLAGSAPVTTFDDVDAVRRAFADLSDMCRQPDPDADVRAALGVHQLLAAVRRTRRDQDRSGAPVLAALRRDAALPLSVAQHARRLGRTADELRDTVRRLTGLGVKDYLVRVRIDRAKQLLADGGRSIGEVAGAVGYEDPGYFSRLFTRRVGVSPSRFRDQAR
ncbi:MAG TPA: helix-turn-helix domain-containing protein [Jatrophihabitantaceae bacterium]|jgi:AraC-like DNA-binding protein